MAGLSCFHCGEPVPPHCGLSVRYRGEDKAVCCQGCQAVAEAILETGLDDYYQYRTARPGTPDSLPDDLIDRLSLWDTTETREKVTTAKQGPVEQVNLYLEGLQCAACAWLIEKQLGRMAGVESASVNLTTHALSLSYQPEQLALSRVAAMIQRLGYKAWPWEEDTLKQTQASEHRRMQMRLGVAGIAAMQVMMYAMALYYDHELDATFRSVMRWLSLAVCTPVVFFSCWPFFRASLRDLQTRHLTMDTPVSLAILAAYIPSVWATLRGEGDVYYESVAMFAFFLLISRYLEMLARQRWQMTGQVFAELTPSRARLIDNNGQEHWCNLRDLCPGQRIAVEAGDIFPVDGHVLLGHSSSDQSIITGEFDPVLVGPGSTVLAGARNVEARLEVEVHEQRPEHTGLGQITQLIREARQSKPPIARMADRQASWLVGGVLVLAGLSYLFWHVHDPDRALWVTLAVLVATCPCALSLATPVALSSAAAAMVHQGFHLIRPDALQTLPDIDQVLLDKTGTLTRGRPEITHIEVLGPLNRNRMLEIGARLEAASRHPFRLAFPAAVPADGAEVEVGAGICGLVDGQTFWLGSPSWVATRSGTPQINCTASNTSGTCIALARRDCCLGWFRIEDQLRDSAYELIARLRAEGLDPCLLTGDPGPDGQQLADRLGIRLLASGASPQDKLAFLDQLRNQGHRVMMVGDGINDIPVLSAANFSVAMGHATDLARIHADAVLVNGQLSVIARAILLSRRTRKVIAQNITWALCYNLVAVPLAVSGFLTPWMAAIGMTSSSLIVVGNAFRLFRKV